MADLVAPRSDSSRRRPWSGPSRCRGEIPHPDAGSAPHVLLSIPICTQVAHSRYNTQSIQVVFRRLALRRSRSTLGKLARLPAAHQLFLLLRRHHYAPYQRRLYQLQTLRQRNFTHHFLELLLESILEIQVDQL